MGNYYPPLGYHFRVESLDSDAEIQAQFQSVSGLSVQRETEEVVEGGENRFKHKLPGRTSVSNLVLKRGILTDAGFVKWCRAAMEDFDISPINLTVSLLNDEHKPLITWNVFHAWPVKWGIGDFNAEASNIVIESIELTYQSFRLQTDTAQDNSSNPEGQK